MDLCFLVCLGSVAEMGNRQSTDKSTLSWMLQHVQEFHEADYGIKVLFRKLCILCELEWPTFMWDGQMQGP